jgi:hypothetical protein
MKEKIMEVNQKMILEGIFLPPGEGGFGWLI